MLAKIGKNNNTIIGHLFFPTKPAIRNLRCKSSVSLRVQVNAAIICRFKVTARKKVYDTSRSNSIFREGKANNPVVKPLEQGPEQETSSNQSVRYHS